MFGGDATAHSMTQIWKHGIVVAVASICCYSCENVHIFSQILSFLNLPTHTEWKF